MLHHQGQELGHRGITTDISEPVYTHIPGPPMSQNVTNRPKQQVLSLCPLLTTNYEALQVCPANHTCNENLIQYQFFLLLRFNLCSFFNIGILLLEACTFSHTHAQKNMEMLLGQPPPVAMAQYISSVSSHLEPPEEQQEQQGGEKCRYERG